MLAAFCALLLHFSAALMLCLFSLPLELCTILLMTAGMSDFVCLNLAARVLCMVPGQANPAYISHSASGLQYTA